MRVFNKDFEFVIPSGEVRELLENAAFIMITSVSTLASPKVMIDNGEEFDGDAGHAYEMPGGQLFSKVRFKNESGSEMTVKGKVSTGRIWNSNLIAINEIAVKNVTNSIDTPAAVTVTNTAETAIAPAAGQRELFLQNNGSVDVWYGATGLDPATSKGIKLAAGSTAVLTTAATVYLKTAAGSTVVSVNKMTSV